jgi:hypothetical protein
MKEEVSNREIMTAITGIHDRLDKLNGYIAKHENRLNTQDVLNAQMTITQQQLVNDIKDFRKDEETNTEYRIKTRASIDTLKYIIGIVGLGGLIAILKAFSIMS